MRVKICQVSVHVAKAFQTEIPYHFEAVLLPDTGSGDQACSTSTRRRDHPLAGVANRGLHAMCRARYLAYWFAGL